MMMLTIATSPGFLHLKLESRFYILFHSEWNLRPAALNKQKLEEKSCLCGLFDALVAHENKHFLGRTVDVTWNLLGSALVWFPSHKFWNHLAASFYWQLADRKNLVTLFVIYSVLTLYYFERLSEDICQKLNFFFSESLVLYQTIAALLSQITGT